MSARRIARDAGPHRHQSRASEGWTREAQAFSKIVVARAATDAVTPIEDVRSTADYWRFVLERVVRRMVLGLAAAAPRP